MPTLTELAGLGKQALLAFVAQVLTELAAMKARVEQLVAELVALKARVAELLLENAALKAQLVQPHRVWVYRCPTCETTVRASHPDLAPDQYGANAHRMGPRAMAAAHATHYGLGVPVRKVPAILRLYTGVSLTQSAITQDAVRR